MTAECLEECDDLILWFSEGKYVYQAMELKMRYKPLTPAQQEKYRQRSEEKNSRFGKIATIRRELPPEAKLQSEKTEKDIDSEVAETEPAEEQREVISEKVHKSGKKSVNEGNEEDVKENHVKRSSSEVRRMGTQEAFIKAAGSKFAEEPEKKVLREIRLRMHLYQELKLLIKKQELKNQIEENQIYLKKREQ